MTSPIRFIIALIIFSFLFCGCSGGGGDNPIIPSNAENESEQIISDPLPISESDVPISMREMAVPGILDFSMTGDTYQLIGNLGGFQLALDSTLMTAELISLRQSSIGESYLVNGAAFFTIQPCSDCLEIQSLELTPDNILKVNFLISHPFEKGDPTKPPSAVNRFDLDVFDLALVVVPQNVETISYPLTGVKVCTKLCANVDGFTRELNAISQDKTVCPYFLVLDESESNEFPSNRFEMGMKNYAFSAYFSGSGIFDLYLTMGYGASAKKNQRLNPTYYVPEFNRKSAWKIEVIPPEGNSSPIRGNTWDDVDTTTPYEIMVRVWDWQQKATVAPIFPDPAHKDWIFKSSRVSRVSAEIPGMTDKLHSVTTSEGGTGEPSNPLIYKIAFPNENSLAVGEYAGLVKVADERVPPSLPNPGQPDSLVHTDDGATLEWHPIPEFATYQTFIITVVHGQTIVIDSPNGGETWYVRQPYTINWHTTGPVPNVNIELSTDGGANYTIPIAVNAPNTGSYDIPALANWPTEHARIRVYMASLAEVRDESDSDFTIICPLPSPPSDISATDGNYWDRIAVSWKPVETASGYNIYRDNELIKADFVGNTYTDTDVTMGTVYYYQIETIDECGTGAKGPESPGEAGNACVLPLPPSNLVASDGIYTTQVVLNWQAPNPPALYNIYRDGVLKQSSWVGTSWADSNVTRGVLYRYDVESINTCGPSLKKIQDTGYALGCTPDDNNTCQKASYVTCVSTINDCVDMIDKDWFHFFVTPNGFTSASTVSLTIPSGTVNIEIYAFDPGGNCPGTLLNSRSNTGSTIINLSASSLSHVYVHLIGVSGMTDYTMVLNVIPVLTNVPIEIYVATTNGTSTGTWPTNGATPLTHATLLQMVQWNNYFWNLYGYNLVWDQTETFMAASYYTLEYEEEDFEMHDAYGRGTNKLSLYFVDQAYWASTAYCWVFDPQSDHNVDNVFTVYTPNVWTWQNVIAHEHGHATGYLNDQYLYPMYGCPCGDNVCLEAAMGEPIYLFSITNGCYMGNQMYYANPSYLWSQYEFRIAQWNWVHEFAFLNPTNFPWY